MNFNPDQYTSWTGEVNTLRIHFENSIRHIKEVKNDIEANGWKGNSSQNFYNGINSYIEELEKLKNSFEEFVENVNSNYNSSQILIQSAQQGV